MRAAFGTRDVCARPPRDKMAAHETFCPVPEPNSLAHRTGAPQTARAELVSLGRELSLRDAPLYSWIIAPRAAVATRVES